jgi:ribosomal-protein-alanine N-acetyltransferase
MNLEFKRLTAVDSQDIIALNNHPEVLRQMPLGTPDFDEVKAKEWVRQKDAQWDEHGYGPWAFFIDDEFAGWGGLQHEDGDADLALVLHPRFWGSGKAIYGEIVKRAFTGMELESITILLPISRTRTKGIARLGFQADGEVEFDGVRFQRFRLYGGAARFV